MSGSNRPYQPERRPLFAYSMLNPGILVLAQSPTAGGRPANRSLAQALGIDIA